MKNPTKEIELRVISKEYTDISDFTTTPIAQHVDPIRKVAHEHIGTDIINAQQ